MNRSLPLNLHDVLRWIQPSQRHQWKDIQNGWGNKFFITCPFSRVDPWIKSNVGDHVFFISGMAGRISFSDITTAYQLREFLYRNHIAQIYFVNDVHCRFMNGVLGNLVFHENYATREMYEIMMHHSDAFDFANKQYPLYNQYLLARLNIRHHFRQWINHSVLGATLVEQDIICKGLITDKTKQQLQFISLSHEL